MKPRLRIVPTALALTLAATAWVSAMDQGDDEAPLRRGAVAGRAGAARDAAGPAETSAMASAIPAAASSTASAPALAHLDVPARRGPWSPAPARALTAWGLAASASNRGTLPQAASSASAASQPAQPPRFPYTWIGRIDTGSEVQVLLNGPQRSFGARAGEVLDGRWRIEQVAATRLQLTWLPTGETVMVDAR